MKKKQLAFVLDTMIVGGVERALIELFHNIDLTRYDLTLFLRDDNGPLHKMIPDFVRISYYGDSAPKQTLCSQLAQLRFFAVTRGLYHRIQARRHTDEFDLSAYHCIRSMPPCSDEVFDCVIAYHALSPIIVSTALFRIKGRKKVLFVHGRNVRPPKLNRFYDKVFDNFDRVFCVSKKTMEDYQKDFPISGAKAQTMYNLFDTENILRCANAPTEVPLDPERISLVTVGRLVYVKGQDMIPRTARILLDQGYDIRWYLAGDGDNRTEVEKQIHEWGVDEHVILLGTQMNPYPYIKNCDIYVQPSRSEGFCTATVEAKILLKPVVTTNAPGMSEQFTSGENGLIVESPTPEALANGIRLLLVHPELRQKFIDALKNGSVDNLKELQKLYDFIEGRG